MSLFQIWLQLTYDLYNIIIIIIITILHTSTFS